MAGPTIREGDWVRLQQIINTLWDRTTPHGTNGFVGRDPGTSADIAGTTINGWAGGTWTEVNLAGFLPKGTKAVLLRVAVSAASAGVQVAVRAHGSSGNFAANSTTQVPNIVNRDILIIPTGGLQSIDVSRIGTIDPANTSIAILGWWT